MVDRRSFLKSAAVAAAAVPFHALVARTELLAASSNLNSLRISGYGPLVEALDEATGLPLLKLPEGFRYVTYGWAGDTMADGRRTPGKHDGMAAFEIARRNYPSDALVELLHPVVVQHTLDVGRSQPHDGLRCLRAASSRLQRQYRAA